MGGWVQRTWRKEPRGAFSQDCSPSPICSSHRPGAGLGSSGQPGREPEASVCAQALRCVRAAGSSRRVARKSSTRPAQRSQDVLLLFLFLPPGPSQNGSPLSVTVDPVTH